MQQPNEAPAITWPNTSHRLPRPAGKSSLQVPANPWRVQSSAIFSRLDVFMERCHDVLEVCNTSLQFSRLERVEIGGSKVRGRGRERKEEGGEGKGACRRPACLSPWTKTLPPASARAGFNTLFPCPPATQGKGLSNNVHQVHADFLRAAQKFQQVRRREEGVAGGHRSQPAGRHAGVRATPREAAH